MQIYSEEELTVINHHIVESLTQAGFTGVAVEAAELPPESYDILFKDDDEQPPIGAFSKEIHYHRVKTDQATFGLWLHPYPSVDIRGIGVEITMFYPDIATDPKSRPDWCFIGLEETTFQRIFDALQKAPDCCSP